MPYEVAYLINCIKLHPVTAWRTYFGWSIDILAEKLDAGADQISQLESSNHHLKKRMDVKISKSF